MCLVFKDFKNEPHHDEWAKSWVTLLIKLQWYALGHHSNCLQWGEHPFQFVVESTGVFTTIQKASVSKFRLEFPIKMTILLFLLRLCLLV